MADCFKYHEMISCLIDGELSPEEKAQLDRHIVECEGCRSLLHIYELAFDSEMVEPPPELVSGAMLKVRAAAAAAKRRFRKHMMRYVAAAACFALILFTVPSLPNNSSDKNPDAVTASGCEGSYVPGKYETNEYMASVTIDGQLPELLEEYTQTDTGNGSYTIKVRSYMVAYLASLGYTPNYNSGSDSDWSLVIYNP